MPITINFTAMETALWLSAIRSFLELVRTAVVAAETEQTETLDRTFKDRGDPVREFLERSDIEDRFRRWLPTVSAYSAIVLLHSLVETQLLRYARLLKDMRGLSLDPTDLGKGGLDRLNTYMTKVAGVPLGTIPGWQTLRDLQDLRDIIVHRRGKLGSDARQQETVARLVRRYSDLALDVAHRREESELRVGWQGCASFVDAVDQFFSDLNKACGFPETAWTEEGSE